MTIKMEKAQVQIDVLRTPLPAIEAESDPDVILDAVIAFLDTQPPAADCLLAAQRMDAVYAVKVLDELGGCPRNRSQLTAWADHLGRAVNLFRLRVADASVAQVTQRWEHSRGLLSIASQQEDPYRQQELVAHFAYEIPTLWRRVMELIHASGPNGLAQGVLRSQLANTEGFKSPGAISQRLGAMKEAHWIQSVAKGREKLLFLGPEFRDPVRLKSLLAHDEAPTIDSKSAFKILAEAVCLNQHLQAEFQFFSQDRHKNLRLALEPILADLEPMLVQAERRDRKAIQSCLEKYREVFEARLATLKESSTELNKYLSEATEKACLKNFELLEKYFRERSDVMPRISLKGIFKPRGTGRVAGSS